MTLADVEKDLLGFFWDLGFRFHPAYRGSDGKLHNLKKWPQIAAKNRAELDALLAEAQKMGAVERLGVVPPENWMIVDLDEKDGKQGIANFTRLCETYEINAIPYITVKSRTGGLHLYYRTISKYVKTVSNVAKFEGVDIRGQGGFVYAPYRIGPLDSWQPGEYLLFGVLNSLDEAVPFNDKKLFLEHTKADDKKILGDDIRQRARALHALPKGSRDETLHYAVHEMYRNGYAISDAHSYLDWLISICEQDDEIQAFANKFHATIDKVWEDEKKLIVGSVVELDVVIRAMRSAELYTLRAEKSNGLAYVPLQKNAFALTPYIAYGRDVFLDALNMFQVTDVDGKIKGASKAVGSRLAALLPNVDRRGFIPRSDVTVYTDPISGAECVNTYRPIFNETSARQAAQHANPRIWPDFLMFLEHLFADKAQMALEMIAWMVHRPDRKMITSPVFISETHGVGKDTLINIVTKLIGEPYVQTVDQGEQLINSKLNLSRALVLYVKELQLGKGLGARNKIDELGGRLKTMITENKQRCEEKFQQQFDAISFCNILIASNRNSVAQLIDSTDRRYNIFDCVPTLTLDNFSQFDLIAKISKPGFEVAELSALWLHLADVKFTWEFDRMVAPMDDHKRRLLARDYDTTDQFLLDNLPAAFTQHFAALLLVRGGMADPREAFQRAEYFIRHMLRREIDVIKISGPQTNASWQFSGCKAFRADSGGCTWGNFGFKPPRPYVYVRASHPLNIHLLPKHDNTFWRLVEDFYDKMLNSGGAASLSGVPQWDPDVANQGLEILLNSGSLQQAIAAVPNAKGLSVH